jgi:glycosyltransferase involved in cell wall biosynthesis
VTTGAPIIFISGKHPIREIGGFGHSAYVRAHARAAMLAGFAPHLFCVGADDEVCETPIGSVYQCRSVPPFRGVNIIRHATPLARAVENFAIRNDLSDPLIVHSFGVWTYAGVQAVRRLESRGIKAVAIGSSYTTYADEAAAVASEVSIRDGLAPYLKQHAEHAWVSHVIQRYERRGYGASRFIMVNYRSVQRMIEARHGNRVTVRKTRYSAESAFLRPGPGMPYPRPDADFSLPRFVCVSHHGLRKGVDVLLYALARLRDRKIPFRATLVSGGVLLDRHRRLARELGLQDHVNLTGVVPLVEPFLDASDIFVLPSRSEQSGSLSLIEAMASRLPAVASSCDGIPEDLEDGTSGLLVTPGSVDELAVALERMATDPDLRVRLALAARAQFEKRFSPAAFADDLSSAYAEAVQ